ncbi:flavin reductase [Micromonospora endophytica]|uniref:Flavin reductase n=1 Tax=Micromonospora endophytica TaxID=515350 RepID=A0A2W2DIL7_9ACTN|nr:flavin reductase [Micromonospora endophytica]PZG00640.1 flavin reductase [Micromonospora endophytica]RIW51466.1 flavin reductase [Micromonospora endophytica]
MSGRCRAHLPSRPTWRCHVCGSAWPCGTAKVWLLAEYGRDRISLLIYLATLQQEAAEQLADLGRPVAPRRLTARFTAWVPARPARTS